MGPRNLHFNQYSITSFLHRWEKHCTHSKAHSSLHEKAQLTAAPAYSSRRRAKDAVLSHWAMSRPEFCSQLHFDLQFFMLLRNMPPICNNRRRQTLKVLCINVSPENLRDSFKFYIVKRPDFNFDADYLLQVLVSVLVASLTKNALSKQ